MNTRLPVAAALLAVAATACSGGGAAPSTQTVITTTTSTSASATKAHADPAKWAGVYCTAVGRTLAAGAELKAQNPADPAGVKAALLKVQATTATATAEAARQLDELGPPGPDVENEHRALVQHMKATAEIAAKLDAAVRALEPNAEFWANAEKVIAANSDPAAPQRQQEALQSVLAKPPYATLLTTTPACVEMAATAKANGIQPPQ